MPLALTVGARFDRLHLDPLVFGWLILLGLAEFVFLKRRTSAKVSAQAVLTAMAFRAPILIVAVALASVVVQSGERHSEPLNRGGDFFGSLVSGSGFLNPSHPFLIVSTLLTGVLAMAVVGMLIIPACLPIEQEKGAKFWILRVDFALGALALVFALAGAQANLWMQPGGIVGR